MIRRKGAHQGYWVLGGGGGGVSNTKITMEMEMQQQSCDVCLLLSLTHSGSYTSSWNDTGALGPGQ
eukprot:m.6437 g.6437  ORF g.6437 m.6437 type:complete len:66 (+) comp4483_c0_seq1:144-341(+)